MQRRETCWLYGSSLSHSIARPSAAQHATAQYSAAQRCSSATATSSCLPCMPHVGYSLRSSMVPLHRAERQSVRQLWGVFCLWECADSRVSNDQQCVFSVAVSSWAEISLSSELYKTTFFFYLTTLFICLFSSLFILSLLLFIHF